MKKKLKITTICAMVITMLLGILGGTSIPVEASGTSTPSIVITRIEVTPKGGQNSHLQVGYEFKNKPANTYTKISIMDSAGSVVSDTGNDTVTGDNDFAIGGSRFKNFADGKITVTFTIEDSTTYSVLASNTVERWVICNCMGNPIELYDTEAAYNADKDNKAKHNWSAPTESAAATCTSANKVQHTCARCGKVEDAASTVPALGHDYTSVVTKAATMEEEGIRTYTCTRCNDSYTETIAKLAGSTQTNPADPAVPENKPNTGNTPDSNTGEENDPETSTESTEPTQNNNSNNDSNNDSTQTSMAADNTTTQMTSPKTDEMNIPALLAGICIVAFCIAGYLGEVQKTKCF